MSLKKNDFVPEFVYLDDGLLPTVIVPIGKDMPGVLFTNVHFHTGEFEVGPQGEEVPIYDADLYQYFSYNHLKDKLDDDILDTVRVAMGLEPLKQAFKTGKELMSKVKSNVRKLKSGGRN